MKKSFQIIEPEILESLYRMQVPFGTVINILSWLSHKVNKELRMQSIKVEIEVIKACYTGEYPALGAYYFEQSNREIDDSEDVEDLVIELCNKFIKEALFSDFFNYQTNHKEKIKRNIFNYYNSR